MGPWGASCGGHRWALAGRIRVLGECNNGHGFSSAVGDGPLLAKCLLAVGLSAGQGCKCADPPRSLAAPKRQHQSDAEEAVGSGHAVARCCGGAESQACQDVGPIVFPHAHGSRSEWERCRFKPTQSKKAIGSLIGGRGQGGVLAQPAVCRPHPSRILAAPRQPVARQTRL